MALTPDSDPDDRPWRPAASGRLLRLGLDPAGGDGFGPRRPRDRDALRKALRAHNAPAPLLVSAAGLRVHAPARPWLRDALVARGSLLFHWSSRMLEAIDPDFAIPLSSRQTTGLERTLRDALDAYDAFGIELGPLVPEAVLRWWREARRWRIGAA